MVSRKNLLCILSYDRFVKCAICMHGWLGSCKYMHACRYNKLVDDVLWASYTEKAASSIKLAFGFRFRSGETCSWDDESSDEVSNHKLGAQIICPDQVCPCCILYVWLVSGRKGKTWTGNKHLKATGWLRLNSGMCETQYHEVWARSQLHMYGFIVNDRTFDVVVAFLALCLRIYPAGFGRRLLEVWLSTEQTPVKVLRTANQDVVNDTCN